MIKTLRGGIARMLWLWVGMCFMFTLETIFFIDAGAKSLPILAGAVVAWMLSVMALVFRATSPKR